VSEKISSEPASPQYYINSENQQQTQFQWSMDLFVS